MKSIILAAGYGTRMYPLTLNTAKGLLDINGKPVMDYLMENLVLAKPNEVCIICNDKFYKDYLIWAKKWEGMVKIKLINDGSTSDETKLGALKDLMLAWQDINEEVLILASDNLLGFSLKEFNEQKSEVLVAVHDLENKEEAKKHGVVELKNNEIIGLEEKPMEPKTTLASICCYKFNNQTKELLKTYLKEGNKDNTGNFVKYLIGKQKVNAFLFKEKLYDIGSIKSYEQACEEFK
jgi:glucose-1-phosphate thymidylyltransferase